MVMIPFHMMHQRGVLEGGEPCAMSEKGLGFRTDGNGGGKADSSSSIATTI